MNKKAKERWQKIQNNKSKCCLNCTQLCKDSCGRPLCYFRSSPKDPQYGGCILQEKYIKQPHTCYDKYNGKNV